MDYNQETNQIQKAKEISLSTEKNYEIQKEGLQNFEKICNESLQYFRYKIYYYNFFVIFFYNFKFIFDKFIYANFIWF